MQNFFFFFDHLIKVLRLITNSDLFKIFLSYINSAKNINLKQVSLYKCHKQRCNEIAKEKK